MHQTTSVKGIEAIMQYEGLRLAAYKDSAGVWTIGFGHTRGVQGGDVISQEQAKEFLAEDLKDAEDCVKSSVTVGLTQPQFDALVSFVFNIGCPRFRASTLLQVLNQGNHQAAADELLRWTYAGGRELAGLVKRRIAERRIFLSTLAFSLACFFLTGCTHVLLVKGVKVERNGKQSMHCIMTVNHEVVTPELAHQAEEFCHAIEGSAAK